MAVLASSIKPAAGPALVIICFSDNDFWRAGMNGHWNWHVFCYFSKMLATGQNDGRQAHRFQHVVERSG